MDSDSFSVISFDSLSEMTAYGSQMEEFKNMNTDSSSHENIKSRNARLEAENKLLKAALSKHNDVMPFLHTEEQSLNNEILKFQSKFKDLKRCLIEKKKLEPDSSSFSEMENHFFDVKNLYETWKDVSSSVRDAVQKAVHIIETVTSARTAAISDKTEFKEEGKDGAMGDVNAGMAKLTCKPNTKTEPENEKCEENVVPSLIPLERSTEKLCDDLCGKWRNLTGWGVHSMTIEKLENGYYRTTSFTKSGSEVEPSIWRPDGITRENILYFQLGNSLCTTKHEPGQYSEQSEQYKYKSPTLLTKTITYRDGSENVLTFSRL